MYNDPTSKRMELIYAEIKKNWDRLTDAEIRFYNGRQGLFYEKIQQKHGMTQEEARKQMQRIEKTCGKYAESAA